LLDKITSAAELTSLQKATMSLALASADRCLADGADEHLQLLSLLLK